MNHEARELKWKLKTIGKALGRAGEQIHRLRGEVALLRRGSTSDFVVDNERLRIENEQLRKQLNHERDRQAALTGKAVIA